MEPLEGGGALINELGPTEENPGTSHSFLHVKLQWEDGPSTQASALIFDLDVSRTMRRNCFVAYKPPILW